MPRTPRIELSDGLYHVTSRGNRRVDIFLCESDRVVFMSIMARTLTQFDAAVFAYCLMDNHYHLMLYTRRPNLSALMAQLNGRYVQAFNRRHRLSGSLLEDRFKAIHVDKDAHLLAACAYVERNPVAAGIVERARAWHWSSVRANVGLLPPPAWLSTSELHAHVLGRMGSTGEDSRRAQELHEASVDDTTPRRLWHEHLREGRFLGGEAFVARIKAGRGARRS